MAYGTIIKKRRRMMSLSYYSDGLPQRKHTAPRRGEIHGWTDGMASRLGSFIDNFRDDFTGMLTLTYGDNAPMDGEICKKHLHAFTERARRDGYFKEHSWVWFLEFQARGAPHFHLLLTGWLSKAWCAEAWASITQGDKEACTRVEALRAPTSAGAYARKYARKSEQKIVPLGFERVGRFWGCSGAKRNSANIPRQPVLVAATEGKEPYGLQQIINEVIGATRARVYDSPAGYVIYGEEAEINYIWRHLWECGIAITDRLAVRSDTGQLRPLVG